MAHGKTTKKIKILLLHVHVLNNIINMRAAERNRLNVMEMRCLRSMCEVTQMDWVRNEEVRRRTGVVK